MFDPENFDRDEMLAVRSARADADRERTEFRLGELFCGPGGLALGAMNAGGVVGFPIVHQWANDMDPSTCLTFRKNICEPHGKDGSSVIEGDVRNLDYGRLQEIGGIDGFAFGFPCNDFSLVGEQRGLKGTYGPLYTYGLKGLAQFQPMWFVAENVGGIRSDKGATLRKIISGMKAVGYRTYSHYYKFEEYGVPQARHRVIIVGIREDLEVDFGFPSPEPFKDIDVSVRTALTGVPRNALNNEPTRHHPRVIERLNQTRPGENAWTAQLDENVQLNVKGAHLSQIYKRLHPDLPAYTVTGSGGGGTHMYHWEESRALTNRERARLQTFPDEYEFLGTKENVRRQIGMAVPPKGAQVIFEALLKSFKGIPYPTVPSNLTRLLNESQPVLGQE